MMTRRDYLIENIYKRWGTTKAADACRQILCFITERPDDESQRLTFIDLARASGLSPDSRTLLQAISILATRFEVLSWHFVLFDEHGAPHDLSDGEARHFLRSGDAVNPETGEVVHNAAEFVSPYFSANREYLLQPVTV